MTTHVVRLEPGEWDALSEGRQSFLVRHGGAQFQKGDSLMLERTDDTLDAAEEATRAARAYRRTLHVLVRHVMTDATIGIEYGYVILGIDLAGRTTAKPKDDTDKAEAKPDEAQTVAVTTDG